MALQVGGENLPGRTCSEAPKLLEHPCLIRLANRVFEEGRLGTSYIERLAVVSVDHDPLSQSRPFPGHHVAFGLREAL